MVDQVNIFDCQNKGLRSLPRTVLNNTDRLLLSGNELLSLTTVVDYLSDIAVLNLSYSNVTDIRDLVMENIVGYIDHLDIRGNKLKSLPQSIMKAKNGSSIWISQNPYQCNCDMLWMRDWLLNTDSVMDKNSVLCSNGKMKGKRNY